MNGLCDGRKVCHCNKQINKQTERWKRSPLTLTFAVGLRSRCDTIIDYCTIPVNMTRPFSPMPMMPPNRQRPTHMPRYPPAHCPPTYQDIHCAYCDDGKTTRGTTAVCLATHNKVYSADLKPPGVCISHDCGFATSCRCIVSDMLCTVCGNAVGYTVLAPCSSCVRKQHNSHRYIFSIDATKARPLGVCYGQNSHSSVSAKVGR
jgi:hypothetical protein